MINFLLELAVKGHPYSQMIKISVRRYFLADLSGAPNDNFWKISVRKTIWDLEFSEHLLLNFLLACLSEDFRTPQKGIIAQF